MYLNLVFFFESETRLTWVYNIATKDSDDFFLNITKFSVFSAWNWCNKLDKKHYYPIFKLCGFTGFDGSFKN